MRIDKYLVNFGYVESRNRASILIEKNSVLVNGKPVKASFDFNEEKDVLEIKEQIKYVSMGGYKLEKALIDFNLNLQDKICIDIGCSTGGFTQVLLLNNAKKIYALDVNTSLLDSTLAENVKVYPIQMNIRDITENSFSEKIDFACVDCSFISVKYFLDKIPSILTDLGEIVALIKPQFECGQQNLTKNGIVKDKKILKKVCLDIKDFCESKELYIKDFTSAPIRDNKNVEFLLYITKQKTCFDTHKIIKIIEEL